MRMDKKKLVLYTVIIVAAMTASLLFSLAVDRMFGKMASISGQEENLPVQSAPAEAGFSNGRDTGGPGHMSDRSNAGTDDPDPKEEPESMPDKGEESSPSDIRLSEDSIAQFYEERDRGDDLDDRYDSLAAEARFGTDCEELEKDRIALVRQLRGYLENTVKDGKDLRSVSVYRMGREYFVTADIAGKQKDLHIIRYGNGYDFENVFIPSDE